MSEQPSSSGTEPSFPYMRDEAQCVQMRIRYLTNGKYPVIKLSLVPKPSTLIQHTLTEFLLHTKMYFSILTKSLRSWGPQYGS